MERNTPELVGIVIIISRATHAMQQAMNVK